MVRTIVLKVKIPGLGMTHDFLVPVEITVHKALQLIAKILREEYPAAEQGTSGSTLLQASSGLALDGNSTFEQLEIINGDTFILL